MKKIMKKLIMILFCLVMVCETTACGGGEDSSGSAFSKRESAKIIKYSKKVMAESLKDPKSAKFCDDSQFIIKKLSEGKYQVYAYCEGKNSYGTMVGSGLGTIVSEDNGDFTNTGITMMEQEEWKTKRRLEDQLIERQKKGESVLTHEELETDLLKNPYYIEKTVVIPKDEQTMATGDLIEAVIVNKSDKTIKNAVIAFAAWDKNNNPITIKGSVDITDGAYIEEVNYDDINMLPNSKYGEDSGYTLNSDIHPAKVRAIIVSLETTDGSKWENPNYLDFVELYEDKKNVYTDKIIETFVTKDMKEQEDYINNKINLSYKIKNYESYSGTEPGIGNVAITNNGDKAIKSITIRIDFDDNNGKSIYGTDMSFSETDFEKATINAGETWKMDEGIFYPFDKIGTDIDITRYKVKITDIEFEE